MSNLNEVEIIQIKTICEYLFFDQFNEYASFPRFEKCFQPLFNSTNISLDSVFKEICGPKKKYINYPRMLSAFKKYKTGKLTNDTKYFFQKLLTNILSIENWSKGESPEECFRYSTNKSNKKRSYISLIEVLTDDEGIIHGLNVQYDGIFSNRMYPTKLEESLNISLEMNLGIIDEKPILNGSINQLLGLKEKFFRDLVTHIFGTFDKEKKILTFLGFKCASGKTVFVGYPKGEGFLFGKFGCKLSHIKIEMTIDGITKLEPCFDINYRPNFFLKNKADNINENEIDKLILDESEIAKITNEDEIDKLITTPVINDDKFFNKKLEDIISGNDYKEVVNQAPRKWLMKLKGNKPSSGGRLPTLNDALKIYDEEKRKRGHQSILYIQKEYMNKDQNKFPKGPMIKQSMMQHFKKRLNGFKGPRSKKLRFFGPKGIDPLLFTHTLAGFNAHMIPHGPHQPHGPHAPLPLGMSNMPFLPGPPHSPYPPQEQNNGNILKNKKNKNKDEEKINENIPHPLCPDCQKLFGLTKDNPEKLRYYGNYYGNNYGTSYGYNYSNNYNYNNNYNTSYNNYYQNNYGYNYNNNNYNQNYNNNYNNNYNYNYNNNYNYNYNNNYNYNYNNNYYPQVVGPSVKKEEKQYENILIPDVNPEKVTSLSELESQLKDILTLLENKNISPEDRKKLEQLKNLYLQQKNILIENETRKAQEELINQLNIEKLIKEEEEKRKKQKEEEERKIQEEIRKEKEKEQYQPSSVSISNIPDPKKIYKNQQIYKGTSPWTDPTFKPEKKNLCPYDKNGDWVFPEDVIDSDVEGWEKLKWARAEEIFNTQNYQVFVEGTSADDIIQGSIGDCYFLSAIGSLCRFPKLINRLFYTKGKTNEHEYGIYIFINGLWELVLIDDYFPYSGSYFKQFAFGSSRGNELWLSLLEKAWAKINGCYAKIGCGGTPNEVFDVLTEAYSEYYVVSANNKDALWNKMLDSKSKGYVMTAGTSADVHNLPIEEKGLSPGHAYTVMDLLEINGEKVMRLRNPWGNGEYTGDWSDSSKKWTSELKKKYNFIKKDDGDFYMAYEDYLKYYVVMGFGKLHQDFVTRVLRIEKTEAIKCQVLKVDVPQNNCLTYLQLYQKNPRIILNDGTYQPTVLCYLILVDSNFNYIDSMSTKDMHICVEETLNKGTYYLLCDVNYRYCNKNGKNHGYNVTAYAPVPITLSNITSQVNANNIMHKAMIDFCKKNITPSKKSNGLNIYTYKNYTKQLPFMVTAYENTSNNYYKTITEVTCKGEKSFCIYCDNHASESDTVVEKQLPARSMTCVIILKYSNSSIFSCSSTIQASSESEAKAEANKYPSNNINNNVNNNANYNNNASQGYNHPVFNAQGEAIDDDGYLVQYLIEGGNDTYVVGLENRSNYSFKLAINLEGLDIVVSEYIGQSKPIFVIKAQEKKVFNIKVKDNYYGNISFQFEYV